MSIVIPILTELKSEGIDKAITQFKSLETTGQKAQFAIKKAAVPATAALAGVGAALFDATKAAMEDEAAQKQLSIALKNTTGASDAAVASAEDWISAQGRALGVADDDLRPALAKLSRQTHDVAEAEKAASLAMDISAATGKDLSTVSDALAKAYGGNLNALSKLSPELKGMIKDGASLDDVMKTLSGTFGGAATEAANTAQGGFKRLKLGLDETKESIGAALIPIIDKAMPTLLRLSDWAQAHPDTFSKIAMAIGGIAAAIVATNVAMAANPFVLAAIGIGAIALALDNLYSKLEKINKLGGLAVRILMSANILGQAANLIGTVRDLLPDKKSSSNSGASAGNFRMFENMDFGIPAMADGGIVNSPTLALIGERGPEAVVPLNRAGGMGNTINISVNGGDPNAVVAALRSYMRQNGAVPIRVVS